MHLGIEREIRGEGPPIGARVSRRGALHRPYGRPAARLLTLLELPAAGYWTGVKLCALTMAYALLGIRDPCRGIRESYFARKSDGHGHGHLHPPRP